MIKTLDKCNIGEFVRLWCIGWNAWDDDTVKVIEQGVLTTVEYRNGTTGRFACNTKCKSASF
jgi:hypothetical protein